MTILCNKNMRLNYVSMWCKTHVLPHQFQHATLSYHIFKNKCNHTQSILIPIYKSNHIGSLLRCIEFKAKYQCDNYLLDAVKYKFFFFFNTKFRLKKHN